MTSREQRLVRAVERAIGIFGDIEAKKHFDCQVYDGDEDGIVMLAIPTGAKFVDVEGGGLESQIVWEHYRITVEAVEQPASEPVASEPETQ